MINKVIRIEGWFSIKILFVGTLCNELLIRVDFGIVPVIRHLQLLLIPPVNKLVLITATIPERDVGFVLLVVRMSEFSLFVMLFGIGLFIG